MHSLWLGIGCRPGVKAATLATVIALVSQEHHLDLGFIQGLGTIDRQAQEAGLVEICHARQWQLRWFSAAELAAVPVPHPSPLVQMQVGTPSVAEAAALLAAGPGGQLLVGKQIYRLAGNALTIAVAHAPDRMC